MEQEGITRSCFFHRVLIVISCCLHDIQQSSTIATSSDSAHFIGSHNPAQVKRNVLTSFTNVLLLPVTIVPRTVGAVGAALTTSGNAAVQGIAMLNPQRWGGSVQNAYSRDLASNDRNGQILYEHEDEDEDDFAPKEKQPTPTPTREHPHFTVFVSLDLIAWRSCS
jgi:hypothetical protein